MRASRPPVVESALKETRSPALNWNRYQSTPATVVRVAAVVDLYCTCRQLVETSFAAAADSFGSVSPVTVPPVEGAAPTFWRNSDRSYVPTFPLNARPLTK